MSNIWKAILSIYLYTTSLLGVVHTSQSLNSKPLESTPSAVSATSETSKSPTSPAKVKENSPTIIYVKPDYSELIKKLEGIKACWSKAKKEVLKENCTSVGTKEFCKREGTGKYVSYSSKEKKKAQDKIDIAINKLNRGVFVDIYEPGSIPYCPNGSVPLHIDL